jgi:hypothetical protein
LQQLQRGFAEALLSIDAPIPPTVRAGTSPACASRFGVYRNNVVASLIAAVASRYPACRKLLSPESFDAAARLYVMSEPPRSPILLHYGETFPRFLRRIGDGAATSYVADIAELETARVRAYHSADSVPVPVEAFGRIPERDLSALRMKLHPTVSLLRSRFPIVSAWKLVIADAREEAVAWRPESAIVARPQSDVEVWRLPAGGFAFFCAINEGRPVAEAVVQAIQEDAAFDLAACFSVMISARAVIALDSGR